MFDESLWLGILIGAALVNMLSVGLCVWIALRMRTHHERRRVAFYQLLAALGGAAKTIDEFAKEDHRTFDSMKEMASAMGVPHMRGLEDYRNKYVERFDKKIKNHLDEYNHAAGQLLTELDENPDNYRA